MEIYVRDFCGSSGVSPVCLVCLICMVMGLFQNMSAFLRKEVIRKDYIEIMKGNVLGLG